jgi:release factor glutamine methyltransferase
VAKLRDCLETASNKLDRSPNGRLEAEILLAHALEATRSFLYANPELELPSRRVSEFRRLVRRRMRGEPIAYITGRREFWSLPLHVTPEVLIPRPETESLVEAALARIPEREKLRIADLGTGSGAVAIAIARERPSCEVHATDTSSAAIELAAENATRLGIRTVSFHLGSWFGPLTGRFDVVVSNPPYVAAGDPHLEQGDLRFEPRAALCPGPDALAAIREIAAQAAGRLNPGGWLLVEHGTDQGEDVREIFVRRGFREIGTDRDLGGHERVTCGQM